MRPDRYVKQRSVLPVQETPETHEPQSEEQPQGHALGAFTFGLLVGTLVGAATAILLTPQAGSETREQLGDQARRLHDRASGLAHEVKGGLERLGHRMKPTEKTEGQIQDQLPSDGIRIL
ncbi:YtxH domain-containing protein [bacterium CPR1]|nr:YtxH domain-containing protein [bacterium CPR1]